MVCGLLAGGAQATTQAITQAAATATRIEPDRIGWTSVRLEARKLFVTATTSAEWSLVDGNTIGRDLLADDSHQLVPPGPRVAKFEVHATLPTIRSTTTLWMDAGNANALQYRVRDAGRRYRDRTVRFAGDGAIQHTRRPAKGENERSPATWTDLDAGFWPYGTPVSGPVLDALGLLYVAAGGPLLKPGDHVDVVVFQRRKLIRVGLTVDRLTDIPVAYRITGPNTARDCRGTSKALQIRLSVKPYAAGNAEFDFLGLESDIFVLVEPESRLILKIEGRAKIIGHVVSALEAVQMPSAARCPGFVKAQGR